MAAAYEQDMRLVVRPTQSRKTGVVIDVIENSPDMINFIISDNFCVQGDQTFSRVRESQGYDPILLHYEATNTKDPAALWYPVMVKKRFTVVLLNNKTRLPIVTGLIQLLLQDSDRNINIFLDEADKTIKLAIKHIQMAIGTSLGRVNTYFVTATPAGLFARFGQMRVHETNVPLENLMNLKDMELNVIKTDADNFVGEVRDMMCRVPYAASNYVFVPGKVRTIWHTLDACVSGFDSALSTSIDYPTLLTKFSVCTERQRVPPGDCQIHVFHRLYSHHRQLGRVWGVGP